MPLSRRAYQTTPSPIMTYDRAYGYQPASPTSHVTHIPYDARSSRSSASDVEYYTVPDSPTSQYSRTSATRTTGRISTARNKVHAAEVAEKQAAAALVAARRAVQEAYAEVSVAATPLGSTRLRLDTGFDFTRTS